MEEGLAAEQDLGECWQVLRGEMTYTVFVRDLFGGEGRNVVGSDMHGVVLESWCSRASAWAGWSGWPATDCGNGKQGSTCSGK